MSELLSYYKTYATYLCGRNDMFCGGLPTDNGIPRMACPFARSTLVIGSDNGGASEHAAAAHPVCAKSRESNSRRQTLIMA